MRRSSIAPHCDLADRRLMIRTITGLLTVNICNYTLRGCAFGKKRQSPKPYQYAFLGILQASPLISIHTRLAAMSAPSNEVERCPWDERRLPGEIYVKLINHGHPRNGFSSLSPGRSSFLELLYHFLSALARLALSLSSNPYKAAFKCGPY